MLVSSSNSSRRLMVVGQRLSLTDEFVYSSSYAGRPAVGGEGGLQVGLAPRQLPESANRSTRSSHPSE